MTAEAQRIAIAETCKLSWVEISSHEVLTRTALGFYVVLSKSGEIAATNLPDYLNDLNAMHDAEKTITDDKWPQYRDLLNEMAFQAIQTLSPKPKWFRPQCCTAAQRAEAFLRVKGLWK